MSKPTYISLFSSAGIGCYGFKQNGFECIATNELLPDRLEIQKANKRCKYESGYILGDITTDEVRHKLMAEVDYWKTFEHISDVDVVFATPPCQGMSSVNYKKSDDEQIRNSLVVEAIRIIREIQPKIFVFENVRAFMKTICTDISGDDMTIENSILTNLSPLYNIYSKVINFKDYGVPSSRPRTIVIGTSRTLLNVSPLNLFPTRQNEITLRESIGNLHPLSFGGKDPDDPFHFARTFPEYMLPWIENIGEGESAFSNTEEHRRPYRYDRNGNRVGLKGAYMGNKYRRLFWDRPCACIATRNDQLASQDTIHPRDNRVLSIRELMRLMTIPDTFKWTSEDYKLTVSNAADYLKKNELNIRRCIGESVPTYIIYQIASKIKQSLEFETFVNSYFEGKRPEANRDNFYIDTFLFEQEQNSDDTKNKGAVYTPQSVVFNTIKNVTPKEGIVKILEPSVGLGAFIPQICSLFSDSDHINIDAVEIDINTIRHLHSAIEKIDLGKNVEITFYNDDFLKFKPDSRYDYIFTNPPYVKSTIQYKHITEDKHKTKNLFALFMIKFRDYADDIICVIPKNFIMADEFDSVRDLYRYIPIVSICDFGVKFFKKVFIEILSIHFSRNFSGNLTVQDFINNHTYTHPQNYIYHDRVWLIYRNSFFDNFISHLKLDTFTYFRDRQITNSKIFNIGKYRVLKSKNIQDDGSIISIPGYDRYIDSVKEFAVSRYLNTQSIIMPNFTYNTRASLLPDETVTNGSIAILTPKPGNKVKDLSFYATESFREYYAIVKSYSRFTLNIDNCSLYYIGIPNEQL